MELSKFFVAVGIAILLTFFLGSFLSTVYKSPKVDSSSCYQSLTSCYNIERAKCADGDSSCLANIYNSQEYRDCNENQQDQRTRCLEESLNSVTDYQTIYYVILAILASLLIVGGFFMIKKQSIGAGFIGGGILTLIFAQLFASLSILTSSLSSGLLGMTGLAVSEANKTASLTYWSLAFNFIGLCILILFAYLKLERKEGYETHQMSSS